jgi:hypothetical protein
MVTSEALLTAVNGTWLRSMPPSGCTERWRDDPPDWWGDGRDPTQRCHDHRCRGGGVRRVRLHALTDRYPCLGARSTRGQPGRDRHPAVRRRETIDGIEAAITSLVDLTVTGMEEADHHLESCVLGCPQQHLAGDRGGLARVEGGLRLRYHTAAGMRNLLSPWSQSICSIVVPAGPRRNTVPLNRNSKGISPSATAWRYWPVACVVLLSEPGKEVSS